MSNEPVAWTDGRGNYFDKNSFFPVDDLTPLYTHPENNASYEKGFIDGMSKMTESAVHRAVESMSTKTLTDEEILEVEKTVEYNQFMTAGEYALNVAKAVLKKVQEK